MSFLREWAVALIIPVLVVGGFAYIGTEISRGQEETQATLAEIKEAIRPPLQRQTGRIVDQLRARLRARVQELKTFIRSLGETPPPSGTDNVSNREGNHPDQPPTPPERKPRKPRKPRNERHCDVQVPDVVCVEAGG